MRYLALSTPVTAFAEDSFLSALVAYGISASSSAAVILSFSMPKAVTVVTGLEVLIFFVKISFLHDGQVLLSS